MNLREWTLTTLLNAAEAQIMSSAQDEKDQARLRAKIYAPPKGVRGPSGRGRAAAGMRMTKGDAKAILTAAAAQDAQAAKGGR